MNRQEHPSFWKRGQVQASFTCWLSTTPGLGNAVFLSIFAAHPLPLPPYLNLTGPSPSPAGAPRTTTPLSVCSLQHASYAKPAKQPGVCISHPGALSPLQEEGCVFTCLCIPRPGTRQAHRESHT